MSTTQLTLDAPGAAEALGRAYALLRRWAREAEEKRTADGGEFGDLTPSAASDAPAQGQERRCDYNTSGSGAQL